MFKPLAIATCLAWPLAAVAEPVLLMAEEEGCYWCEIWDEEIAHIYPKTAEGRTAPLQRYDLHHETPDVEFKSSVRFTPTFILVDDGRELARIEGYPGEDFFWGMLAQMFECAGIPIDAES